MFLLMVEQLELVSEKEIANYCSEKSVLVSQQAIGLLAEQKDYRKIVDELISENVFVLNEGNLREKILKKKASLFEPTNVVVRGFSFRPLASETEAHSRVLQELDTSAPNRGSGKVTDFLEMFRDKFEFLSELLKKRANLEAKPIQRLLRTTKNNEITVCGIVSKKWVSKKGHAVIELEDTESRCLALFMKNDRPSFELSQKVCLDDVVAVKGKKISDDMLVCTEVHWPDLPIGPPRTSERDLNLLATSDIHVGSKLFLEKEFQAFLSWLSGKTQDDHEREEIGKIKYLLICGDNVDGIGVYPDQYDELEIKDIFEQYDVLCDYLKQIPEYIETFVIPGQHDAVRRADPQPGVPKKFLKGIEGYKNIHFVGSPSWIEIEGLKAMLYHGASLHDLYATYPGLDYAKPEEGMAILLKRRDLMVSYGAKQPYVPEKKDLMVIRHEPDFYFGGDMHRNGYLQYRGCSVINAGTWQARTEFQVQQGHIPTPGIGVQVSLNTRKISEKRFV
ncbi:MAG: metallophosphoesterase [Candidatus Diapherotrites archaeon]|nr:metallophosphoesterase [Candidatus Diapherotrites archaeon]